MHSNNWNKGYLDFFQVIHLFVATNFSGEKGIYKISSYPHNIYQNLYFPLKQLRNQLNPTCENLIYKIDDEEV